MASRLLEQLDKRIDNAIETIEILRLQVEELETKNATLEEENQHLKSRQTQWEQGLNHLLGKLDDPTLNKSISENLQEIDALV